MDLNPFFLFLFGKENFSGTWRGSPTWKKAPDGFHEAMPAMRGYFFHEFPDELTRDPNKK